MSLVVESQAPELEMLALEFELLALAVAEAQF